MALPMYVIKERLKEIFGTDSQTEVGRKLDMTQGNVSKLLAGQQPAIDTIYRIAEVYGVSVDWLLGLSENKNIPQKDVGISYSETVKVLHAMWLYGVADIQKKDNRIIGFTIKDPMLKVLLSKHEVLFATDMEIFKEWGKEKLSLFDDKQLLDSQCWNDKHVNFLAGEAKGESDWLVVYREAKRIQDEYMELMRDECGPFGR